MINTVHQNKAFGFVVLHYLAYGMTRRCVDVLLSTFKDEPIRIVVVDNASPDGSGAKLEEDYVDKANVTVLRNSSNLGFARGNNEGYNYLLKEGECGFIAVINNDVLIQDSGFISRVSAVYSETGFAVLGPDIVNPSDGRHQNPAHLEGFTREDLTALRDKLTDDLDHFRWKRFKWNIKCRFFPFLIRRKAAETPLVLERREGVVLHGACYVFSPLFLSARRECFNPSTFLYLEEDILHFECMRDGLKMLYEPSLQVLHLEDVSSREAFGSKDAIDAFKFKESLKSIEVLLALMEGNKKRAG